MAVERNPLLMMEPELQQEMPTSNFDVRGETPSIEAEMLEENIINFMPTEDGGRRGRVRRDGRDDDLWSHGVSL